MNAFLTVLACSAWILLSLVCYLLGYKEGKARGELEEYRRQIENSKPQVQPRSLKLPPV